jgi:hypothetical protein
MFLRRSWFDRDSRGRVGAFAIALAAAALVLPLSAHAGAKITTETRQISNAPVPNQAIAGTIWLDGSKLRMEAAGGSAANRQAAFIFRGDKKMLWALDGERKTYVQLDQETIDSMRKRISAASQQLEAHMKGMSDKEREMMQKMMAGFAPGMEQKSDATPKTFVKQTSETKEINGKLAKRVDLMRGKERVGEVWLTDWKSSGVESSDFAAFRELAAFQRGLRESLGTAVSGHYVTEGFDVFDQLEGFPLLIRRYVGGKVESETAFTAVSKLDSDGKLFEVPDGYQRTQVAPEKNPPASRKNKNTQ